MVTVDGGGRKTEPYLGGGEAHACSRMSSWHLENTTMLLPLAMSDLASPGPMPRKRPRTPV